MFHLKDSDHYKEIVAGIVEQFWKEIEADHGVIVDIANAVLAGSDVVGEVVTVNYSAEVWGTPIEATVGETLNPYEVVMYSNVALPNHSGNESTWELASACLTQDIAAEQRHREREINLTVPDDWDTTIDRVPSPQLTAERGRVMVCVGKYKTSDDWHASLGIKGFDPEENVSYVSKREATEYAQQWIDDPEAYLDTSEIQERDGTRRAL